MSSVKIYYLNERTLVKECSEILCNEGVQNDVYMVFQNTYNIIFCLIWIFFKSGLFLLPECIHLSESTLLRQPRTNQLQASIIIAKKHIRYRHN